MTRNFKLILPFAVIMLTAIAVFAFADIRKQNKGTETIADKNRSATPCEIGTYIWVKFDCNPSDPSPAEVSGNYQGTEDFDSPTPDLIGLFEDCDGFSNICARLYRCEDVMFSPTVPDAIIPINPNVFLQQSLCQ